MAKCSINPSTLHLEWSSFCRGLTSQQAVRLLHRFTSGLLNLYNNGEKVSGDSCLRFLEKRVAYDLLDGKRLSSPGNLSLSKSLSLLHEKIIDLNSKALLKPKDVSLSLNSYAKFYQSISSNRKAVNLFNFFPSSSLKGYVSQLLDIANTSVQHMNEQDLSLVLNCISKINIRHDEFLKSSNQLLYNSVQDFHRLGLSLEDPSTSDNLMKNMTPQGVALLLNCFSKSDVELSKKVLAFFVDHYVPKMASNFMVNQLIVSLNAFLKFKVPLEKVQETVKVADGMLRDSCSDYNLRLLSTALYTFSKYNYYPTLSFQPVVSYLTTASLKHASELELSNIYYALGKLNVRNLELLDKINQIALPDLNHYTPHGVVGIFHSLSKLDYKGLMTEKQGSLTMEEAFLSEFLKLFRDAQLLTAIPNTKFNFPVVPLHTINFGFSCAINQVVDPRLYNFLLNKLACMIGTDPSSGRLFGGGNVLLNYREELTSDDDQFKFLSKHIGIQGVYQLYCILQHVLSYTDGGLESLDLSVLSPINSLLDHFHFIATDGKRFVMEELIVCSDKELAEASLDETSLVTSKIHEDVYSVLENILKRDELRPSNANRTLAGFSGSKYILYKEHEAIPYTIDIVLFKF